MRDDSLAATFIQAAWQVNRLLNAEFDKTKSEEGRVTVYMAVLHELRARHLSMAEIIRIAGIQKSTATRVVDRLVELQMVERYDEPEDRRAVHVKMTSTGKRRFDEMWERSIECVLPLFASLGTAERAEFARCLAQTVAASGANGEAHQADGKREAALSR